MRPCPTCGLPTPEGNFCVRCGAPQDQPLDDARDRRQFAAAPGQHKRAPWLVSTLFPRLPRHAERHFHAGLAISIATVVALGALRLFGVALITAAALMPIVALLYFYDASIYERSPAWTAAWSIGWGAAAGTAVGLLAKALAPTGPALIDRASGAHAFTGGVVLPALGVVLMLIGPLALLREKRFNDTLDGAGFGALTAAAFAAAEAIVVGGGVLGGGLRPAGEALPWIERLAALAIATPVLAMSAIGSAVAAVWLRYRSPAQDRASLGSLGSPPVAIAIAAALVVTGAIGETFLPAGGWLVWLLALDAVGLLLLRRAIHLGLQQESAEKEIGPVTECSNCHAQTAVHTFCGNCGIALRALPKGLDRTRRRLITATGALAITVAVALAVSALAEPPTPAARCKLGVPCGSPPILARALYTTFPGFNTWQSSKYGYALRYNSQQWSVARQGATGVQLQTNDGSGLLAITAAGTASPQALLNAETSSLQGQLLGFTSDNDPRDQLLGTNVGLRPGPGAVYTGTISSPQGPEAPVAIAIVAAAKNGVTIAAATIASADDPGSRAAVYQQADDIIDSIVWQ